MSATHIWCSCCEAIKPLLVDEMPGTDVTGKFTHPTDLICGKCRLVICTTYSATKAENYS